MRSDDEIRADASMVRRGGWHDLSYAHRPQAAAKRIADDVELLLARAVAAEAGLAAAQAKIAAVEKLHIPMQWDGGWRRPQPQTLCRECVVPWPCSTAAALDLPVDAPEAK